MRLGPAQEEGPEPETGARVYLKDAQTHHEDAG